MAAPPSNRGSALRLIQYIDEILDKGNQKNEQPISYRNPGDMREPGARRSRGGGVRYHFEGHGLEDIAGGIEDTDPPLASVGGLDTLPAVRAPRGRFHGERNFQPFLRAPIPDVVNRRFFFNVADPAETIQPADPHRETATRLNRLEAFYREANLRRSHL